MTSIALRCTTLGLLTCLAAAGCSQQSIRQRKGGEQAWLTRTLAAQEAELTRTYDTCDLHRLRAHLFAGTTIRLPNGRRIDPLQEARERICGQRRREVAPHSLVVRPIGDDSALVTGDQRFCAIGVNPCRGTASHFVTLWTLYDSTWRMSRMLRFPD